MRVKFWSDTNQEGFLDAVDEVAGVRLEPVALYEFEIPEEVLPLAEEWGATVVGGADA